MTSRERLLNSIYGLEKDRVSFAPFLAYYWENQPIEIQKKGMKCFCDEIGADYLHRGSHVLYKTKYKNCEYKEIVEGYKRFIFYITPIGTIKEVYTFANEGNTWFLTEHCVKSQEDLKILTYFFEDMFFIEDFEIYENDKKYLGNEGLYIPVFAPNLKSGFQSLTERYLGVEELTYALCDFQDDVENFLQVYREKSNITVDISLKSSAECFIFWEDSSTTLTSPNQFVKYVLPEINDWADKIHKNNKKLIHHACGHLKDLLPFMAKSKVDIIESISPPPTGNINIENALKILPKKMGIIGGIEPTKFLNGENLEEDAKLLINQTKDRCFILSNSDSCPPNVAIENFKLLAKIAKE